MVYTVSEDSIALEGENDISETRGRACFKKTHLRVTPEKVL